MSPEIYENKPYNQKSDVWSLGCILYEMCTNELAFSGKSDQELRIAICTNKPPDLPGRYSKELRELLNK